MILALGLGTFLRALVAGAAAVTLENVADHATAAWAARQIVQAFPDETAPTYLLRDRDAVYGEAFTRCVANPRPWGARG